MSLDNCLEVLNRRDSENVPDQQGISDVGPEEERVGVGEGLSCGDLPGGRGRNPSSGSGVRWRDEGAQGGGLRWEMGATESCLLLHQGEEAVGGVEIGGSDMGSGHIDMAHWKVSLNG